MKIIYEKDAINVVHKAIYEFFDFCDDDEESPMTHEDMRLLEINKAISTQIKELPSAQPDIVQCKDCKHFYLDKPYVIQGVPVLGHEVCDAWGDGCKTSQDGYCFLAERRTDECFC